MVNTTAKIRRLNQLPSVTAPFHPKGLIWCDNWVMVVFKKMIQI